MHGVDKVQQRLEIDMAHECLIKTFFFVGAVPVHLLFGTAVC